MRLIVLLLMGSIALAGCDKQKAAEGQGSGPQGGAGNAAPPASAQTPVQGLNRNFAGQAIPDIVIKDGEGEEMALSEFKGSPVLVNLWASWCVPCVKELPTLDALAGKEGAIEVVALSQDMGPLASVTAFLAGRGIKHLATYQDTEMAMSDKASAPILPTTILYDRAGREVWRFVGDRDWTSTAAAKDIAEAASGARAR